MEVDHEYKVDDILCDYMDVVEDLSKSNLQTITMNWNLPFI